MEDLKKAGVEEAEKEYTKWLKIELSCGEKNNLKAEPENGSAFSPFFHFSFL
jgi:hypothetical protein